MKKQIVVVCVALFLLVACKQNKHPEVISIPIETKKSRETTPYKDLKTQVFAIEGMHCAMGCAASIEKRLNRSKGIQKAQVSFENQKATVSYDTSELDESQIKQLIESIGDGKSYKVVVNQ